MLWLLLLCVHGARVGRPAHAIVEAGGVHEQRLGPLGQRDDLRISRMTGSPSAQKVPKVGRPNERTVGTTLYVKTY